MFDDFSKRAKAVRAAFKLAAERGWGKTSLADIAQEAGLSLSELRREFSCKNDILSAFQKEVDAEVLAKAKTAPEQNARDRLFDIIMTRFEVMTPYKPALKRISSYLACRPGEGASLACSTLTSQYWMLAGAGAKLDGPGGALRVAGLAGLYAQVFQVWLKDDSPSLDKTMAALDRRLTNGERWLARADQVCERLCRFASAFAPRRKDSGSAPPPNAGPAPSPAPSVH